MTNEFISDIEDDEIQKILLYLYNKKITINRMKNICIVSAGILPIPDVKGGAVERLITMIAECNEKTQKFNITVITCPDKDAIEIQSKYQNTKFINLKPYNSLKFKKYCDKIDWHLKKLFNISINFVSSSVATSKRPWAKGSRVPV